ncbi:type II toxin-antitoxin system VapC family toxin [uncultured Sphingomonas sp.]|uniref:type II toxin-antitoxin system VapC family toxin n=1 Tax=uncultured Sphingomonas sp. TaxID=158754 RepID=UPI0035CBE1B7
MRSPEALLDSNVLVAAVAEDHERHASSLALVTAIWSDQLAVAAHSYTEAFNTLTRRGARGQFQRSPDDAWAALSSIVAVTRLVGLTPSQTLDGLRLHAAAGGIGARLYDHLIGQAAVLAGARVIVTWNTGHLRSLFPGMAVETPEEHLTRRAGEAVG